jgi:allene oxide cyclase-like protein
MLRKLTPILTAAALAGLIVGGVSAASGPGGGSSRDFTALDITVKSTDVDVDNSNSFTVGDENIFQDVLKNRAGTKEIGSVRGVCTAVEIVSEQDSTVHCVGTVKLRGGTIEFAGLLNFSEPAPRLAFTGGTGRYDEAGGQVTLRFLNDTETVLHVDID